MCFKQDGAISTLNNRPLKLVDQFRYISSKISSTERIVNIGLEMMWTALDRLLIIWKWDFFLAVAMSLLLYDCTTPDSGKC